MKRSRSRTTLLSAALALVLAAPLPAEEPAAGAKPEVSAQTVSPEAQAVIDAMTTFLKAQKTFSIDSDATRDEVVAFGYKLQHNEHSTLTVRMPDKLRAEISGDLRDRTFVYDGAKLALYSPDANVYVTTKAPDSIKKLVGGLLDAGVEMPTIDVLYQTAQGTLTDDVRGGVLVGDSNVDGVDCDHLAFRQATIDWQLWVEKGAKPLPRKILITTRYAVGDPQFQAILHWNLQPKVDASTFVFAAPKDAKEIPFAGAVAINDDAGQ